MSRFECGTAARLLIQVSSDSVLAVRRHCPRCGLDRRFASSGKFRVNAHRKRIDAWLIFRCSACDERWNWPVHERQPVATIDPRELDALMRNEARLALEHGRAALRGNREAEAATDPVIDLLVLEPATDATPAIELAIAVRHADLRLDRLLAQALALARREIAAMEEAAVLFVYAGRKALRRPAVDGQRVMVALADCPVDLAARLRRLCGA